MNRIAGAAGISGVMGLMAAANGAIVITEIHYNPNGSEGADQEWIEIVQHRTGQ